MHIFKDKIKNHSIAKDCNANHMFTTPCAIQSNKSLKTVTDHIIMNQGTKTVM